LAALIRARLRFIEHLATSRFRRGSTRCVHQNTPATIRTKWPPRSSEKNGDAIPIEVLFYHRESLATLSALAVRAYLPAYLLASVASDDPLDTHGADIRGYLLSALGSWPPV